MSQNLLKRLITSIVLLSLLIFISFSHQYIFILSILIIGLIICIEANNLFSKLLTNKNSKKNSSINVISISEEITSKVIEKISGEPMNLSSVKAAVLETSKNMDKQ